jgi:acyl carrier protein
MVTEDLKKVILQALKLDNWDITDDTQAGDVPGWDSLSHVNVLLAVEQHFQVRFRSVEALKLKSVGDLQRLVDSKLQRGKQ